MVQIADIPRPRNIHLNEENYKAKLQKYNNLSINRTAIWHRMKLAIKHKPFCAPQYVFCVGLILVSAVPLFFSSSFSCENQLHNPCIRSKSNQIREFCM